MNNRLKYAFFKSWTEILKTSMYFTLSHIIHVGYAQLAKMQCLIIQVCLSLPVFR